MGVPLEDYRRRISMNNAALNIFETVEGRWKVVSLNDVAHLPVPAANVPDD
jgi:hypothetical protein